MKHNCQPSGKRAEYVVSQPPMPVSIPRWIKLKKVISQAVGLVQIGVKIISAVSPDDCCPTSREFKKTISVVKKNNPAKTEVGKNMLVGVPRKATNGWLKIAPMPQKKFKIFKAAACLSGFISAISIFIEVKVAPIPTPKITNPAKQIVQSLALITRQPNAKASIPSRIEKRKPKRLTVKLYIKFPDSEPTNWAINSWPPWLSLSESLTLRTGKICPIKTVAVPDKKNAKWSR